MLRLAQLSANKYKFGGKEVGIFSTWDECKTNECKLCCLDRDINASKNILGLLLNQYRGEERPVCFKPAKIGVIPRKSDKRPKACDSPLQPC